ncbi:energy transducer TonB [Synechocystis sp. PCC 7509]|uniref:energy transducer TonB n=1 Tax=Synechocystis sp. PCC 7509 TaxID=927677 RepID=UPI0002ABCAC5|nr:energy transducer TonB [Synechocystis sp. PCC 7509]
MSLPHLAVEQRKKEAKTLNWFLAFSLIGSLALHISVLVGLGKFLSKTPIIENEPIEIAIVELPTPQKLELQQKTAAKGSSGAGNNGAILSKSGSSSGFGVASRGGGASQGKSSPKTITPSNSSIAASTTLKVAPVSPNLSQKSSRVFSAPLQNQKIKLESVPAKPVIPSEIVTQAKPVTTSLLIPVAKVKPAPVDRAKERSSQIQQLNNQRLNSLLAKAKSARDQASAIPNSGVIAAQQAKIVANLRNQAGGKVGTGNSTGNELRSSGTGNGNGAGNGNRTGISDRGNGNGTGTGNGRGKNNNVQSGSTVATARNTERQTSTSENNRNSSTASSSGRLACRTCSKPKYPENARKRKLEGKAEISVDVDSKGNVTNVRLAQTSGHAELDKAAVEQARNWKFNAPNGAVQGVTAKVDFAIEGSKKSRQNRERRRQKVAARKNPVARSQNTRTPPPNITKRPSNTALGRSLRRQSTTPRRRVDTLPPRQTFDQPQRRQQSVSQTKLRNTLRRSPQRATSPNQTKLRQSLRLYQQKSSTPNSNEP